VRGAGAPVVILASGTRGDVQPFLALALGLRRAGVPVVIAAAPRFQAFVEERGITFAPLEGNPSDLMAGASGSMATSVSGGAMRGIVSTSRFLRTAQPEYRRMLDSAAAACRPARAVLAGISSTWGFCIAEALNVPGVLCMLQPFGRTSAFPSALLPVRLSLGRPYNRVSYRVVEQAMWLPWRRTTNTWRRRTLGLRSVPFNGPWKAMYAAGFPCIYGFSPEVVPPPLDWPASHVATGYWFLDEKPGWAPRPALERFVASGNPPLYVGFGSMGAGPGGSIFRALEPALEMSGLRAVVSARSLLGVGSRLPRWPPSTASASRIFLADDAPHSWLFPRVTAVMHHGGAGTTAEGLRAGVPSIILPVAADQYFWAERLARLGVGLRAVGRRGVNPGSLARLFLRAATDRAMRERARRMGERIRAEDGVARAVEALVRILA
jgi:sterol 3beta-glucosyltransferase